MVRVFHQHAGVHQTCSPGLSTVFSISLVLWCGRSQGQPWESCTLPWGRQVCPLGIPSSFWDVDLHPLE